MTTTSTPTFTSLDSILRDKAYELCQTIAEHPEFGEVRGKIDLFLEDDSAQQLYRSLNEQRQELQQRQSAGEALSDEDLQEFETLREQFLANPVAKNFVDAQQAVHDVQNVVLRHISKTYELGRLPTAEELKDECCSEGGCGCQ